MNNSVSDFLFRYAPKILNEEDTIKRENEVGFIKCFQDVDRIMYAGDKNISEFIYKEAAKELKFIVRSKPMMSGRIELLNFFEEQSISHSYHRYGNLGGRVLEDEQK